MTEIVDPVQPRRYRVFLSTVDAQGFACAEQPGEPRWFFDASGERSGAFHSLRELLPHLAIHVGAPERIVRDPQQLLEWSQRLTDGKIGSGLIGRVAQRILLA